MPINVGAVSVAYIQLLVNQFLVIKTSIETLSKWLVYVWNKFLHMSYNLYTTIYDIIYKLEYIWMDSGKEKEWYLFMQIIISL